jgi:catechol 2,3-dioxygenase-like lactoylglutathione lyase family enzyme
MKLEKPVPILRMFDEAMTKEFYVDFLGFRIDWEHRFEGGFPLYLQVSHGECVLHLSGHFGDATPGAAIRIAIDDIDGYQQGLLAKQYKHARPGSARLMPWGSRDLTITDPSGNKLTFMQPGAGG